MSKIKKAKTSDAKLLSKLSIASFLPAHGHSASKKDIDNYVAQNFSEDSFIKELEDSKNEYFLIEHQQTIVGYSKMIFNQTSKDIATKNIAYMSRLYLLEAFYGLGLGKELFNFNVALAKHNNQTGIWLAVWVENKKAISFYKKIGFVKVGNYDFRVSETHTNPNHILYLEF